MKRVMDISKQPERRVSMAIIHPHLVERVKVRGPSINGCDRCRAVDNKVARCRGVTGLCVPVATDEPVGESQGERLMDIREGGGASPFLLTTQISLIYLPNLLA